MFPTSNSSMPGNWRKSRHSGQDGNCVETGSADGTVFVRDTKDAGNGPVLAFSAAQWEAFASALKG